MNAQRIRGFAEFCHEKKNARLLIVGSGYVIPELKALAKSLLSPHLYYFTGNVAHSEVFQYITGMNVAVLPNSHWYGSPVKLFEYGAMGKPIIAIGNGPVREIMEPEKDGLFITEEKESLVTALNFMYTHPEERNRMAESFRTKVVRYHTWENTAKRVLESVHNV